MITKYSITINKKLSNIEKYNFVKMWLSNALTNCNGGQSVDQFKITWETKNRGVCKLKEDNV
jgi:hypothetical protein